MLYRFAKHVAMVLRLMENWHGKGHVIYGDSAFVLLATVQALLERGCYFVGMLKTMHAGFPKSYLHNEAFQEEGVVALRGDICTVEAEIDVAGAKLDLIVEVLELALVPDLHRAAMLALATDPDAFGVVA